ncbi:DUF1071 domain-containing protein [Picosynechococcus sp. NKBG15041c]|uniref:DUF1071 domain-containing protein n=1 Tax=Picosynechococcus sp. NKBG15041c TaxID=1407650 RepID=UPI0003FD06C6|nr:DUF1071 domain-containing protein [Picosynechococcus sp. NKBG15041c]
MTVTTVPQTQIQPPRTIGEWSLKQTVEVLSRPIPASMLKKKDTGIPYLPWRNAVKILDKYCPGWTWEIITMQTTDNRLFLTGRLTITTAEGNIYREATGTETLKLTKRTGEIVEHPYGDPSSNAESMAFRRACAKFGLGLYLYQ